MDCPQTDLLGNQEYLEQFNMQVLKQRVPLTGSIEFTARCNLRCIHCYLSQGPNQPTGINTELTTGQWRDVIDQITEAGCLYLLITGGEPFLRKDFSEIYAYVKSKGLLITVFTNATRVNQALVELFKDLPPQAVEVTLYGATPQIYENITGIKGSYHACMRGLEMLVNQGIHVKIKTILMAPNRHEYFDIKLLAEKLGLAFRSDAAVFPRFNCDKSPLKLRIPPKEAVGIEFSDPGIAALWQDYSQRMKNRAGSDALYICGAGVSSYHIDASGNLKPCLMASHPSCNLLESTFKQGWEKDIQKIRRKKLDHDSPCSQCNKKTLCGYCPPFFELETGKESLPSNYLCAMGQHRYDMLYASGFSEDINAK